MSHQNPEANGVDAKGARVNSELPTIAEFRAQVARNRHAAAAIGSIAGVGVAVILLALTLMLDRLESSSKPDLALLLPILAIALLTLAAMIASLWIIDRRMPTSRPTRCPQCKERLVDHCRFVIATRKCRKCRIQVLADPDGQEERGETRRLPLPVLSMRPALGRVG